MSTPPTLKSKACTILTLYNSTIFTFYDLRDVRTKKYCPPLVLDLDRKSSPYHFFYNMTPEDYN